MFRELARYKNHFLQVDLKHLEPETINQFTKKEFRKLQEDRRCCKFPKRPKCPHSTYFSDRAQLAYGWYALPKLIKEMCSDDPKTTWCAINSLSEFLLNPLQAQRAITELNIIRLLRNCFLRFRKHYRKENFNEVARLMHIFYLLSQYLNGADQIARKDHLLHEFYKMLLRNEKHMPAAAKVLRNLTEKPEVCDYMLKHTKSFYTLAKYFSLDDCTPKYPSAAWYHLAHFLEVAPERGIEFGVFDMLYARIFFRRPEYHLLCMKCFGLILRCPDGQRAFDRIDGIKLIYDILENKDQIDNYEFVVLALQHGLMSKRALWRAREFPILPNLLLRLSKLSSQQNLQLYCLRTLRLLGDVPCIMRYMYDNCFRDLHSTHCCNQLNACLRDELLVWLNKIEIRKDCR